MHPFEGRLPEVREAAHVYLPGAAVLVAPIKKNRKSSSSNIILYVFNLASGATA